MASVLEATRSSDPLATSTLTPSERIRTAPNNYDYAGQDPINKFDLGGTIFGTELEEGFEALAMFEEDAASQEEHAVAAAEEAAPDSFAAKGGVYALTDDEGRVAYVGRSSDLAARQKDWASNRPGLNFEVLARTDDYATQRGVEQQMMDENQPYLNKIRGISPSNPRLSEYMSAADRFFHNV